MNSTIMYRTFALVVICLHTTLALRIGLLDVRKLTEEKLKDPLTGNLTLRLFDRADIVAVMAGTNVDAVNCIMECLLQSKNRFESFQAPIMMTANLRQDESFGFIYKNKVATLTDFIRDQPTGAFSAKVQVKGTDLTFALSILHLYEYAVRDELDKIPPAFERIKDVLGVEDVLFCGNFNAASPFLSLDDYQMANVTRSSRFQWFGRYDQDTLTANSLTGGRVRFLGAGSIMNEASTGQVIVLDLQKYFGLSEIEAWRHSKFNPIELELNQRNLVVKR